MRSKTIKINDLRINEDNLRDESQKYEEAAIKYCIKIEGDNLLFFIELSYDKL